jgi:hypothetical protein
VPRGTGCASYPFCHGSGKTAEMETVMADRETIVETRSGGGAGIIAGIVIVALLVVGFLVFFNNGNGGSAGVDVDVPAVNVDVVPDAQ